MNKLYVDLKIVGIFLISIFVSACASSGASHYAPVTDGWSNTRAASKNYRVQADDSLYSIAFRFGLDYRKLAKANHISYPYAVTPGQMLTLLPEATEENAVVTGAAPAASVSSESVHSAPAAPTPAPTPVVAIPSSPSATSPIINSTGPIGKWRWPATGKVVHVFSESYGGNKGIDIAGKLGDPVKSTAAGKVVYSGAGLKSYGLLIIIKHSNEYLSAYAHNSKLLVKEGQSVTAGQTIALMGSASSSQTLLHFEIRQAGKPVNPLKLLTPR